MPDIIGADYNKWQPLNHCKLRISKFKYSETKGFSTHVDAIFH